MWPRAPAKGLQSKRRNPLACGYFDVKLTNMSKPVPHWQCCWPESRCCRHLNSRLSPSTAPPSCCSTWSAGRPDGDTWCPHGSTRRAPTWDQIDSATFISEGKGMSGNQIPGRLCVPHMHQFMYLSPETSHVLFSCRYSGVNGSKLSLY